MIYTHVLNRGWRGVSSPLDRLRRPVSSETGGIKPTGLVGIKPRRLVEELGGKPLEGKQLLLRPAAGGFVLSRPGRGFMQVGLKQD